MTTSAIKLLSGVSSSFGSPGGTISCRSTDVRYRIKKQENVRIGSWNVRTMYQAGKIHNAIKEMDRMNISILGINEMRWPDSGNINIENHKVLYSGSTTGTHEYGVGIILAEKMAKSIKNFIPISSRAILVQLSATPVDPRKLYTWKSPLDKPGKVVRNQIDYILVNQRFRNSYIAVKTYPGADIQSDHVPLVGTFKIRMKKITPKNGKEMTYENLKILI